jgi:hypothetical protein
VISLVVQNAKRRVVSARDYTPDHPDEIRTAPI